MISNVDICNLALSRIGEETITSLTEQTETARRCNAIYDAERQTVLRAHPWNFATKIKILTESSADTVIGWTYVYMYESDCIFARKLFNEATTSDKKEEYRVIQSAVGNYKIIASKINPAYLEYTANITDPGLFDGSFVDALAWKLASELAQSLIKNVAIANDRLSRYYMTLDKAETINASEGHQEIEESSSYINAR